MAIPEVEIFKCLNPDCGLRYPQVVGPGAATCCPRCGGVIAGRLAISRLGDQPHAGRAEAPLEAFFDNIRSAWNLGSMLRSADSAGVHRVYLGGITASPENEKVQKTSLGAELNLEWTYYPDGAAAVEQMVADGRIFWALEYTPTSVPIWEVQAARTSLSPILIVGNEYCGIDPDIIRLCQRTLSIPMVGVKSSLNTAVAFGIAVHWLAYVLRA